MKPSRLAVYACALAISWAPVISCPADCLAARMAKNFNAGTEKAPADSGIVPASPSGAESGRYFAPPAGNAAAEPQHTPRAPAPAPMQAAPQAPAPTQAAPQPAPAPAPAMLPNPAEFPASLTEELHQKFLAEDDDYAMADALLNLTWKRLKGKLDKSRYKEVLQSQRAWVASERDAGARANAQTLPPAKAYAAEILRRANFLAQQISSPPATGEYQSPEAFLSLQNTGGKIQVTGDAGNARGNTCTFDGTGSYAPGWIRMHHEDFPDFLLLSTGNELLIYYPTSGSAQGCGFDVDFKGSYVRNK